ncbi:MAG: hypothetical protein ACI8O8_002900 [Oleiphilaceae bacterium]|jgi:hypothetical protein
MESKSREKFVELAEKRVTKTLKDIRLIGNLSNKSNYSYSNTDVKKIYGTLRKALDEMKIRFETNGEEIQDSFRL